MYNVFTDFHHAGLLQSLILLFERRLGGNVYRPIGMEWADKGFWKVYDHPATQAQFLNVGGATPDGTPRLNDVVQLTAAKAVDDSKKVWVYKCQDIDSGSYNRAITYEGFMNMPIDIVIASLPQHIEPFKKLCALHPMEPKLIYQIGNAWNIPDNMSVSNVMASAKIPSVPPGVNFIEYHQEFDLDIFYAGWPFHSVIMEGQRTEVSKEPANTIYSFVNCFSVDGFIFKDDYALFKSIESSMPEFSFKSFGGQCRDGAAHGTRQVAEKMRSARFIWHTKLGGDGYGHVLFNSAAVGRPLITKKSYYAGKLGEALMIPDVTCINIDGLSEADIMSKIRYYNEPDRYRSMCQAVLDNFAQQVDFEEEEKKLRDFLQKLS